MRRSGVFCSRRWTRKKLVVLDRQGGREDVENAYYQRPAEYSVLFLPRLVVKASSHFFLGDHLSDTNYRSETVGREEAKDAYRDHLVKVLRWFKRLFGLSAILQFNMMYFAEQELALACKQVDVGFVCLQKESAWSPIEMDYVGQFYKDAIGAFHGDAIGFYSATSRRLYESVGLVPKGRGYIVGCARLDESHRLRREKKSPAKNCVVFYLIENLHGFTQMPPEMRRGKGWSAMSSRVNRAMLDLAAQTPHAHFVFKAKSGFGEEQLESLFSSSSAPSLPINVEVQTGGSGHKLLRDASVVVGFNTTAVLEAVAAGVTTIVPNVFSSQEKKYAGGAHLVQEGVQIVDTVEILKDSVLSALTAHPVGAELTPGQKIVLERYLGNSDGRSGERLRDFLNQAVEGNFRFAPD